MREDAAEWAERKGGFVSEQQYRAPWGMKISLASSSLEHPATRAKSLRYHDVLGPVEDGFAVGFVYSGTERPRYQPISVNR